ncbi:hypothetical protein CQW23_16950 [Capsicum baccatum]|uniref:Uncharacterized protein n=1 Tax=Capsicum baccatum TaxID=33114 RepID=A0A2G2WCE2_CAPBA|nr:hypothetical protein CQW23_16950 [Capsicum baccatum]
MMKRPPMISKPPMISLDFLIEFPKRPPNPKVMMIEEPEKFEESRDADDAIHGRDGYDFDGHRLRVELAHSGRGNSSSNNRYNSGCNNKKFGVPKRIEYRLLVTGLPHSASWYDLKVTSEFEKEWTLMKVQGWENNDQENGSAPVNHIGLGYSNTADELMEMGPENLKEVKAEILESYLPHTWFLNLAFGSVPHTIQCMSRIECECGKLSHYLCPSSLINHHYTEWYPHGLGDIEWTDGGALNILAISEGVVSVLAPASVALAVAATSIR